MRNVVFVALGIASLVIACATSGDGTSSDTGSGDGGAADASSAKDAHAGDSASLADASPSTDGGVTDAHVDGTTSDAASSDAANADAASSDAASSDAASDAAGDASADAASADADAGPCVPPNGNFAFCATASATSTYAGYPASAANDGNVDTSWYAADGACPSGTCPSETIRVDLALDAPRTIGRVKLFGNRDYPTGYDTLTARIQLLDGASAVLYSADVVTSSGSEPNGDVDHVVTPAVAGVATVRVIVLTTETPNDDPGIAEIEAYAN